MSEQHTHVVTTPNTKPPTPVEVLRVDLSKELKSVSNYFAGNEDEAKRFMTSSIEYVRRVPKLLETDRTSLIMALLTAAQFRFLPSNASGEAYIIPYGRDAKFQLGYQGLVTLLYRTKQVKGISANIIYANDIFEYEEGLDAKLMHKPAMFGKPKGEAIGVYTVAQLEGGAKTFKVMDKEAIEGIKNLSKAKNSKESPWNSNLDPELWMWRKTCLIQHAKLLPKTPELQKAIEVDFDGEGIEKPAFDAGGPAVGRSHHRPAEEEAEVQVLAPEDLCPARKHNKEAVDLNGVCSSCEAEEFEASQQ